MLNIMFCPFYFFPPVIRIPFIPVEVFSVLHQNKYMASNERYDMKEVKLLPGYPATDLMRQALRMRSLAGQTTGGIKYLLPVEVNALISFVDGHDKQMFIRTLWNTGTRIGEALALTARDCILTREDEDRVLRKRGASKSEAVRHSPDNLTYRDELGSPLLPHVVPDSAYQCSIMIRSLKTRRQSSSRGKPALSDVKESNAGRRLVPLFDREFIADLKAFRDAKTSGKFRVSLDEPLWQIRSRQTVLNWINDAVRRAAENGVFFSIPVSCHTFRHSYAIHLLNAGVQDRMLMELLGHRSLKSLAVYTRLFSLDRLSGVELSFGIEHAAEYMRSFCLT